MRPGSSGAPVMSADARAREEAPQAPLVDTAEVQLLLLALGEALTLTGDAVSEIQTRLRAIAGAYGYPHPRFCVFPTLLIVALDAGGVAGGGRADTLVAG